MSLGGDDGYGRDYGDGYGQDGGRGGTRSSQARMTRTRLPEGDGDPYGPPRRGARPRPSRNLITVVGVVVLLIAAIAFANRGGGGGGGSDHDGDGGTGGGTGARSRPTAPTGERPVTGVDPVTRIAAGFPRTEQGAQSAAANYAVALGSAEMYRTDQRHAIVDAVYAPQVAAQRQSDFDGVYAGSLLSAVGLDADGQAPAGTTFVSRATPVGTRAEKVEGDTATVAVWYSSLLGLAGEGSRHPVSEGWYTRTFQLRWVGDAWKVLDYTQQDGPAPVGRDQAASSAEDMAEAVEGFGGFTYVR
ncbi:hypothetical protein RKE29_11470 [Streptomyces sp. B1866]|uniref:hypothetical protein n=1 Tax=Streptomyces sp. B1866 TaxID=3075431 RepID=UPI00288C8637|nr:hypothetical protein [Streptomyces sp. B1866]MDT3397257.1 hypothetical protein [Streptomyces sp. B1866]